MQPAFNLHPSFALHTIGLLDHPPTDLTIPASAVVELRVRLDNLNKILSELVSRIRHPESESAGLLRIALENGQAIAGAIEGAARS